MVDFNVYTIACRWRLMVKVVIKLDGQDYLYALL